MNEEHAILFVCLGNICRSPAAEGVMLACLQQAGRSEEFHIDSAGTGGYHIGNKPDPRMVAAAAQRGWVLTSRARQIKISDIDRFDLIIAMDRENMANIQRLAHEPSSEIKLLSDFLDHQWPSDVPDPYYGGQAGFEYVLDMLQAACPKIMKHFDR